MTDSTGRSSLFEESYPSLEASIAIARGRFIGDTSEHEMTVRLDHGLYRHLMFRKPGTSMYRFDLVTWPGYFAIVGDCGEYSFARLDDMFEFFAPKGARGGFEDERWGINPQYWAEKLRCPKSDGAEQYSYAVFCQHVVEWFDYIAEDLDDDEKDSLRAALTDEVIGAHTSATHSESEAHRLAYEFEWRGYHMHDSWEWRLKEFRHDFLWSCWAIVWGIGKYNAERS